jgi:membrane-associated phospholipid phosphatase
MRSSSTASRLALIITYVVNPLIMPPLLVWLVLDGLQAPAAETTILVSAAVVMLSVVPALYLVWMVRSGRATSLNLENPRHRTTALMIAIAAALMLLSMAYFVLSIGRDLVVAILVAYMLGSLLLIVINENWKISLHTASAAGFLSVVFYLRGMVAGAGLSFGLTPWMFGVAAIAIVAAVGWARLHLRAHTRGQVVAGAAVGFVVPYLLLMLINTLLPLSHTT